jgi:predicted nuclease of predicted toxin-antitoxin system
MKLLDEGLSPKLVEIPGDLFPGSESALRNGMAGSGDARILEYAVTGGFVLVSTDTDFEALMTRFSDAVVVILRSCNYPTAIAVGNADLHTFCAETGANIWRIRAATLSLVPHPIGLSYDA